MPQDRPKTAPRRLQEGSKHDAIFVLIFDSFWGRFGEHFGLQNPPKKFAPFGPGRSCFRSCCFMVPRWLQDRPKRAPGGGLGPSWGGLGLLLGALGPSLDGLGGVLGVVLVSFWVVLGFDSLIRFIDSIY